MEAFIQSVGKMCAAVLFFGLRYLALIKRLIWTVISTRGLNKQNLLKLGRP